LGDLGLASCQTPRTHEDEGDKRYLSRELLQQHDNCDLFKADIFVKKEKVFPSVSRTFFRRWDSFCSWILWQFLFMAIFIQADVCMHFRLWV
jgi:hypothetical protein